MNSLGPAQVFCSSERDMGADAGGGILNPRSEVRLSVPTTSPQVLAARFDRIYRERFGDVARWARAMGSRPAEVEDVCQEVFLVLRRKLDQIAEQSEGGFLYRVTERQVLSFRRKAWVRRVFFFENGDLSRLENDDLGALDHLTRREYEKNILSLLDRISQKKRSALLLHDVEGYSGEEIASLENVPVQTIYSRLHYARQELLALAKKRRLV